MKNDRFVYVTYIGTTPEKLWEALLSPEFTKAYWFGVTLESEWQKGSPWKMRFVDGKITDSGEVVEIDKPDSKLIEAVSGGWPRILSNLKSLLETGKVVSETKTWRKSA